MATMDWSAQRGTGPASYQEFLVPGMFAPFADRLVGHAEVRAGARVVDIACGTGVVSRAAARRAGASGAVTGVDLGEPTLAIARGCPVDEGAAPIAYVQSDACALPLQSDAFDVALCQQGLQFFPDRGKALAEMRRVLKPDGRIGVATWTDIDHSPFSALADALGHHLGGEAADMMRSPFGLSDGAELAGLVSAAGFRDVVVWDETIECTWSSHAEFARRTIAAGPIASAFMAAPAEAQRAVADEVAAGLARHATDDGRLTMSMTSNVALARG